MIHPMQRKTPIHPWEALHDRLRAGVPWGYEHPDEALEDFLARLSARGVGSVIDIGCGNGRNARLAAARGFRVTGVDVSHTALSLAAQRVPSMSRIAAVIPPFPFADGEFDAAWDIGCLHALHPARWVEYGRELHRVLAPGASVYIHARRRPPRVPADEPVHYVDELPEWGLTEHDVNTCFTGFVVRKIEPHEGRPPEQFLRIFMERSS